MSNFCFSLQLLSGYKTREQAIKKCINVVSENTKQLQEQRLKDPDNFQVMKDLRKEQTKVVLTVLKFAFLDSLIGIACKLFII